MSKNWNYKSGDWNLICDVCSKKIKASEAKQRWDGFIVCKDDYEQRQPLDFIRARQDKISVPFTRPVPTDTFVPQNFTENFTDQVYQIEESLSRVVTYIRELSDSITLSDEVTSYGYGAELVDSISFSDALIAVLVTEQELADAASLSDAVVNTVEKGLTDSITTTTTDVLAITVSKALENSLTISDSVELIITYGLLLGGQPTSTINSQTLNTTAINGNAETADAVVTTDTITSFVLSIVITDTIAITDSSTSSLLTSDAVNGNVINGQAVN